MGYCNSRIHGRVLDTDRKSDTMTWLVCYYCKQDGKVSPVGWWESSKEELMRAPDEEELKKYI
jgi:hypothetical protein